MKPGRERSKGTTVRAHVYQTLHEFNLHMEEGVTALRAMAQVRRVNAEQIRRFAEQCEEVRTEASGYLAGIVSEMEEGEAGQLFDRRRRREMAEDPMHGGWLEEKREKKRQKELRKARRPYKKSARRKKNTP